MKKIDKLLICLDLSQDAENARAYAAKLADKLQGELIIVHVINEKETFAVQNVSKDFFSFSIEKYLEDEKEKRTKQLQEIVDKADMSQKLKDTARIIIRSGVPFKEIIEVIKEEEPDLLVVGRKGRSNIGDVLAGSTARQLFLRSPVPILCIPVKIK